MHHKRDIFCTVWIISVACFALVVFPATALYGEEIVGRGAEEFSGTLKNGLPAEHRILVGTEGTMSLTLSFVGGNSAILLEVVNRNNRVVYRTQTPMAGQFIVHDLPVGNYILRLTPIQKVRKDLSYHLQVLMPTATYIYIEEEEKAPLATAEILAGTKPFPFSAYVMMVLMILWGILAAYLYRFLRNWEQRWEREP